MPNAHNPPTRSLLASLFIVVVFHGCGGDQSLGTETGGTCSPQPEIPEGQWRYVASTDAWTDVEITYIEIESSTIRIDYTRSDGAELRVVLGFEWHDPTSDR